MSLDLRIDGLSADLAGGATLDLSLQNPHFDYTKLAGLTASLPTLPLTRRNQFLFGYWEQPQAGGILMRRRLEQYANGHLIREGTFLLTEAGPSGYRGALVEPVGEFFGDYQNERLSELPLGTIPLPAVVPVGGIDSDGLKAVVFPTIRNADFYGTNGGAIAYTGTVNDFSAVGTVNTPARPLVPMVMLKWLLKRLALATNTTIDGAFLNHPAYSQLLLYNTRALDGATTVTIARHLPHLTPTELILELRKLFNLKVVIDTVHRRLTLDFMADWLVLPPVVDWSLKAVGKPLKTPEQSRRLGLGYELDGGDALMKDKPELLKDYVTPGSGAIAGLPKCAFSTLLTDTVSGRVKAAQPGITAQFGQGANAFGPRLLFYNGVIAGEPDASPSRGGYSLYWNGDPATGTEGLYHHHWRSREAMLTEQFYLKQSMQLTETDLAGLDWSRKVHLNGVNYFPLLIDVSLPIRKPANCLLVAG